MKAPREAGNGCLAIAAIVGAVLLHMAAWSGWIVLASRHPVADVPLAGSRH